MQIVTTIQPCDKKAVNGLKAPINDKWSKMSLQAKCDLISFHWKKLIFEAGRTPIVDDFVKAAFSTLREWLCQSQKRWLFLVGHCGTGKTLIARAVVNAYNHANYSPYGNNGENKFRITDAFSLFESLDVSKDNSAYDIFRTSPKLFIDDIGSEPPMAKIYGTDRNAVSEILQYRYAQNLPTIITSNLTIYSENGKSQIEEFYGARIIDRLREMSYVIGFSGESFRKR